jgi:hypothetical protein
VQAQGDGEERNESRQQPDAGDGAHSDPPCDPAPVPATQKDLRQLASSTSPKAVTQISLLQA